MLGAEVERRHVHHAGADSLHARATGTRPVHLFPVGRHRDFSLVPLVVREALDVAAIGEDPCEGAEAASSARAALPAMGIPGPVHSEADLRSALVPGFRLFGYSRDTPE